jgi:hypothetical protein
MLSIGPPLLGPKALGRGSTLCRETLVIYMRLKNWQVWIKKLITKVVSEAKREQRRKGVKKEQEEQKEDKERRK